MQTIKSLCMFIFPKFSFILLQFQAEVYTANLNIGSQSTSIYFTGRTWKKTISLLMLIKKNMLKLWCYLQAGPCWDYLYKWQKHTAIPDKMAKSRACFCPRLQLSLTNWLPWSWVYSILWFHICFKYFSREQRWCHEQTRELTTRSWNDIQQEEAKRH